MLFQYSLSVVIIFLGETSSSQPNNSCKTFIDYYFLNTSKNCFYNPDLFLQTDEIINRHIGFSETYKVTTEDGYILTIFRIPRQKPKGVIILQHPLTTDSIVWVGQSNGSLAFLLWRLDYDIWLPNNRGTYFSRKHLNLTTSDPKFWDFSFHEIGLYDYKAIIDFVKHKTNNKIVFISHSMSSTAALVYASLRPQEAVNAIKVFISMSPVAYLKHTTSPLAYLSIITPFFKVFTSFFNISHFFEYDSEQAKFLRVILLQLPFKYAMSMLTSFIHGWNPQEYDPALINLSTSHYPRSYSLKMFYHYIQLYESAARFQMYDYGYKKNKKLYGTSMPPEYPLEKIITPTYLIYSNLDIIATPKDAQLLYGKLNKNAKMYGKLEVKRLNHIDFHYGKHRKKRVYDKIVEFLKKIENDTAT